MSSIHSSSFHHFFFLKFLLTLVFFIKGLATMKENKGKGIASGTEGEEDVQVQDEAASLVVQKLAVQARKRKSISSSVDLGDLPRCRGLKKQKPSKTPPPKVPKCLTTMVDLDDSVVNPVLVQTIPSSIQPENPPPFAAKNSHRTHPSVHTKRPPNLVLDEDYAWKMFKRIYYWQRSKRMLWYVSEGFWTLCHPWFFQGM